MALAKKGNYDGAITDFSKAIELNPNDEKAYWYRGSARQAKADLDGAIADYNKAIELNPTDAIAKAYLHRARVALTPNSAEAHIALGNDLQPFNHDLDGAIHEYRQALSLDPNNAKARTNLGGALEEKNPNSALNYERRGFAKKSKGDFDGAIADYNKAIELNPTYATRVAQKIPVIIMVDPATLSIIESLGPDAVFFTSREHPIRSLDDITDPPSQFAWSGFGNTADTYARLANLWVRMGGGAITFRFGGQGFTPTEAAPLFHNPQFKLCLTRRGVGRVDHDHDMEASGGRRVIFRATP